MVTLVPHTGTASACPHGTTWHSTGTWALSCSCGGTRPPEGLLGDRTWPLQAGLGSPAPSTVAPALSNPPSLHPISAESTSCPPCPRDQGMAWHSTVWCGTSWHLELRQLLLHHVQVPADQELLGDAQLGCVQPLQQPLGIGKTGVGLGGPMAPRTPEGGWEGDAAPSMGDLPEGPRTHLHRVLVAEGGLELLLKAPVPLRPHPAQAVPGGVELRPGTGVSGATAGPGRRGTGCGGQGGQGTEGQQCPGGTGCGSR